MLEILRRTAKWKLSSPRLPFKPSFQRTLRTYRWRICSSCESAGEKSLWRFERTFTSGWQHGLADGVTSHAELQTRLEVEAEALRDQQETLRESLRSQGVDVVQSALNVSVAARPCSQAPKSCSTFPRETLFRARCWV